LPVRRRASFVCAAACQSCGVAKLARITARTISGRSRPPRSMICTFRQPTGPGPPPACRNRPTLASSITIHWPNYVSRWVKMLRARRPFDWSRKWESQLIINQVPTSLPSSQVKHCNTCYFPQRFPQRCDSVATAGCRARLGEDFRPHAASSVAKDYRSWFQEPVSKARSCRAW
jgi:hypothetical protein